MNTTISRILLATAGSVLLASSGLAQLSQLNSGMNAAATGQQGFFAPELRWSAVRWGLGPVFNGIHAGQIVNPALPSFADYQAALPTADTAFSLRAVGDYYGAWVNPNAPSGNLARWIQPTSGINVTFNNANNVVTNTGFTEATIAPGPINNYRTNQAGFYAYRFSFNLISANFSPFLSFIFNYTTDNNSAVYVNGTLVGTRPGLGYGSLSSAIDATAQLQVGTNEVVIITLNDFVGTGASGVSVYQQHLANFNPTGLLFIGQVIPEPSTYALLAGLGALGLAVLIRRRKS